MRERGGCTLPRDTTQGKSTAVGTGEFKKKSCIDFLLCDPGWCVYLPERSRVAPKTDGITTHTHTHFASLHPAIKPSTHNLRGNFSSCWIQIDRPPRRRKRQAPSRVLFTSRPIYNAAVHRWVCAHVRLPPCQPCATATPLTKGRHDLAQSKQRKAYVVFWRHRACSRGRQSYHRMVKKEK